MENKKLIGRKVKFFGVDKTMGLIQRYNHARDSYTVMVGDNYWECFASEIEKHLVEEKDWSVTINSPTQHYDQDLLDKFALQALPNIISRISINATHQDIAKECYAIARAMMKERIKGA